ncbi:ABC transporter permease [Nocardioides sp. C4-1]|uniref:ABC transporter permease n=1 Tax=Nocardioides sp. C4-1 TaxID=3151851 RepID=UPI0032675F1C
MTDVADPATAVGAVDEADLPPLRPPSADNGLAGVFRRRYLLKLLVRREVIARYQGSVLGLLWSYINPLSQFFIYYFIMGAIFQLHTDIPNFAIHIFSALVIVHFFAETLNAGVRAIVRNRGLVVKMAMPREMFPVATMLVSLWHVVPQLFILLAATLVSGWRPDLYGMACFVVAVLMIMMLGTGLALLFSAANVFFRDVGSAITIIVNVIRFGVPMIYSYEMVQDRFGWFAQYYLWNPIADAVILFQRAFWTGADNNTGNEIVMPDHILYWGLGMLGVSAVVLLIGQLVFSRLENKIPERL